jgi:D-alanyl-D-alanine-carboxypeptidase/D-alanyl-D-alanine-endopeptidase
MPRLQPIIFTLCLAWAATATTSADAQNALLREAIGLTGTIIWVDSGAPGMVLVVVRGRDTLVQGYGETTKGNGQEPTGHSLLRLGSISKVFATEVLAGMATDGTVKLTDPLQRYAPAGITVPRVEDRPVTLLDLATHSAGLPREIGGAPPDAPPFTWPAREQRWRFLADYKLPWAPGTVAAYSNVGFDLLADALGFAAHKDYPAVLDDRITGPLGMADTGVLPTTQQCDRLMTGSGIGGLAPCVDTGAIAGAGGLYSTGDDMALWLRHNLATTDAVAWPTLALAHAVYRQRQEMTAVIGLDEAGEAGGIALGWVVMAAHGHTPLIVQKTGALAGFMTYIAFVPGRDVGLFVAVNRIDFGMFLGLTAAANNLLATLAPR